jgi:hypothetical protein
MRSNGFSGESRFRRHTLPDYLSPTDDDGVFLVSANTDPSEAVTDVYTGGHGALAVNMGPGLAFTESTGEEWASDDRRIVEVRLQDVLDQGGRIYPVDSIITERIWYFTLPDGSVRVVESGG